MELENVRGKTIVTPSRRIMRYAVDCLSVVDEDHYQEYRYLIGRILWLSQQGRLSSPFNNIFKMLVERSINVLHYAVSLGELPTVSEAKKEAKKSTSFVSYPELLSHTLVLPHNSKSAGFYGRGTKFCTASLRKADQMDHFTLDANMLVYGLPRKGFTNSLPFAIRIDLKRDHSKDRILFSGNVFGYRDDSLPDRLDFWHMKIAHRAVSQLYDTWVEKIFVPKFCEYVFSTEANLGKIADWSTVKHKFPETLVMAIEERLEQHKRKIFDAMTESCERTSRWMDLAFRSRSTIEELRPSILGQTRAYERYLAGENLGSQRGVGTERILIPDLMSDPTPSLSRGFTPHPDISSFYLYEYMRSKGTFDPGLVLADKENNNVS